MRWPSEEPQKISREVRESFPIRVHSRNSRLTCPTLLIQGKSEAEQLG
jgi:hypothetical protein